MRVGKYIMVGVEYEDGRVIHAFFPANDDSGAAIYASSQERLPGVDYVWTDRTIRVRNEHLSVKVPLEQT